jgi:putative cell wall-binding protein
MALRSHRAGVTARSDEADRRRRRPTSPQPSILARRRGAAGVTLGLALVVLVATAAPAYDEAHVVGVVTDATSTAPIADATVILYGRAAALEGIGCCWPIKTTRTAADGSYSLSRIPTDTSGWSAGRYVAVAAPGYGTVVRHAHDFLPDDVEDGDEWEPDTTLPFVVDVALPRAVGVAPLSGTVTMAPTGEPIAEARVSFHYWHPGVGWRGFHATMTDDEGRFALWQVDPGVQIGMWAGPPADQDPFEPEWEQVSPDQDQLYTYDGVNPVVVDFSFRRREELRQTLVVVWGRHRYQTAARASLFGHPTDAPAMVLATGEDWPDALGGSALAGAVGGPLMITPSTELSLFTVNEILRLEPEVVYLLGGPKAISPGVEAELRTLVRGRVIRLGGADRYATSQLVAAEVLDHLGDDFTGTALVATGENFPDALAASPLAANLGMPVLLAPPDGMPVLDPAISSATVLGGPAAVSASTEQQLVDVLGDDAVTRLGGAHRYATAALIATAGVEAGLGWRHLGIATGQNFPDALAGGVMLGANDTVLLLTRRKVLPAETREVIATHAAEIEGTFIFGWDRAISGDVHTEIFDLLRSADP